MRGKLAGALDDTAVLAGENQGRLYPWSGGQVGEKRSDMLWHLL